MCMCVCIVTLVGTHLRMQYYTRNKNYNSKWQFFTSYSTCICNKCNRFSSMKSKKRTRIRIKWTTKWSFLYLTFSSIVNSKGIFYAHIDIHTVHLMFCLISDNRYHRAFFLFQIQSDRINIQKCVLIWPRVVYHLIIRVRLICSWHSESKFSLFSETFPFLHSAFVYSLFLFRWGYVYMYVGIDVCFLSFE